MKQKSIVSLNIYKVYLNNSVSFSLQFWKKSDPFPSALKVKFLKVLSGSISIANTVKENILQHERGKHKEKTNPNC